MIIQSSDLSLRSAHALQTSSRTTTTLRTWAPSPTVPSPQRPTPVQAGGGDERSGGRAVPRSLSAHDGPFRFPVQAAAQSGTRETGRGDGVRGRPSDLESRFATMIAVIEWLTGERVQVLDQEQVTGRAGARGAVATGAGSAPGVSAAGRTPGPGAELTVTETFEEQQAMAFTAQGSAVTADGHRIDLEVDLELYRQVASSRTTRITVGDVPVQDPLVLSFGALPGISAERVALDLNADGTAEQMPFVAAGNAYLVFDADGDGTVDDGRELFGPTTGDGFGELAAHDADGNGWIDEADPVFTRLRLWSDPEGPLSTLTERGVGAIGLARVDTPFRLSAGENVAQLHSTGVWIGLDATVGTVHRIDLAT
ncbi:MAG: hypothetical protein QG608_508 [Actinomycetota bacterium]|nr:hypothetical protein [Actinomycetota bacterium]